MMVVPAWGRDYQTAWEARQAWEADEDFRVVAAPGPGGARYINKKQADEDGAAVIIGFCHLTQWIEVRGSEVARW